MEGEVPLRGHSGAKKCWGCPDTTTRGDLLTGIGQETCSPSLTGPLTPLSCQGIPGQLVAVAKESPAQDT